MWSNQWEEIPPFKPQLNRITIENAIVFYGDDIRVFVTASHKLNCSTKLENCQNLVANNFYK